MYQNHFKEFEKNIKIILELFKKYVIIFIIVSIYVIIIKFQVCIITCIFFVPFINSLIDYIYDTSIIIYRYIVSRI